MSERRHLASMVAAVVAGVVGILFLLIAASLPVLLKEQAEEDRAYYDQFRKAAAYAADYAARHAGQLPEDEVLRRLGDPNEAGGIWGSLSSSSDCDGSFRRGCADQFTLGFWRGEWSECFAYPSGKTTLAMSVSGYLLGGLWWQWAICWLIGIGATYMALRLGRRRRVPQAP